MPEHASSGWLQRAAAPLAFVAGAISVLAFAPLGWWPLQTLCLSILFAVLLQSTSVCRSALIGWMFGFGWLLFGTCWLYISLHDYGDLPSWMSVVAVAGLALLLSALMAAATGVAAWLRRRWHASAAVYLLLILPTCFMLAEWTRAWLFTGFPWLSAGYAHHAAPLGGYAALVGVYGIGLLSAVIAAAVVLLPRQKSLIAIPIGLFATGALLQHIDWTTPFCQPISVRLLQGNIPQDLKFQPERTSAILQRYQTMITAAPADLIATPETALPLLYSQLPSDLIPSLQSFAQQSHSQLLVGVPLSDDPTRYANSVIGIGNAIYRYDKHHLVPFGEFIPPGFRWFIDMMHIPLGDFSRGAAQQQPIAVKDQWVLPNICYEDLFGEEIAAQLSGSAAQTTILLNVSNIAWFGDSFALPQHLQISQMRALETGRPMLRATNTGMTAVIDPKGRVQHYLAPLTTGVLTATVQGYRGNTPYILFGNSLALALGALMLMLAWLAGRKKVDASKPEQLKTR